MREEVVVEEREAEEVVQAVQEAEVREMMTKI